MSQSIERFRQRLAAALLCAVVSACTAPVAYPRTGEVLLAGGLRLSEGTTGGIAPTTATVAQPPGNVARTYRDLVPAGRYDTYWTKAATLAFTPFFSPEFGFGVAPLDGVELGALLGLARAGAELRVGVLGRNGGLVAAAISAGVAKQVVMPPHAVEYRAGLDFSLRTGLVMPLVNVYLAHVPSERGVLLPEPTTQDPRAHSGMVVSDRDELRLSVPVGIAVWGQDRANDLALNWVIALVPEITLASQARKPTYFTEDEKIAATLQQTWAVFLVVRGELLSKASRWTVRKHHSSE
jgi:hypothetical protein